MRFLALEEGGFWNLLVEVAKEYGAVAVVLILFVLIFWRMTWGVWNKAMTSKDEEIERLVAERDKYQKLVFDNLLTSKVKADQGGEGMEALKE